MLGERGAAKVTQASNAAGLDLGQSSEKGDGRKDMTKKLWGFLSKEQEGLEGPYQGYSIT